MGTALVLVAAGKGERLGLGIPKAQASIAGKTLLEHALSRVAQVQFEQVVIVAPQGLEGQFRTDALAAGISSVSVVSGGATRQQSVANGLAEVSQDLVLVHDAARAFAEPELFVSVKAALAKHVCAIPALAVSDTIKRVSGSRVLETVDRSELVAVQTPQGFHTELLRSALGYAQADFTDEAGLMESLGHEVVVVPGSDSARKVTTQADLVWAQGLFGSARTGVGTDAHRFSDSGELTLGCLTWPELPALEGHSDGDSVAHAIVDALLSAAGLGDIGSNFGVDRPEFAGAAGDVFISATLELIRAKGLSVTNVSVQVIADKPKIGPRRAELESRLTGLLSAPVTVSATTTDGLGFLADSAGVAAVATALLN